MFISASHMTANYGIKHGGRDTFLLLYEISMKEQNCENLRRRENQPQNRAANYGERKLFAALVTKQPAFYRV